MECDYCAELTIERLVQLTKVELSFMGYVPERPGSYYQHHKSVRDLELSANEGCSLCNFLLSCLKGYKSDNTWSSSAESWMGTRCKLEDSLFTCAQSLPTSDLKFCISPGLMGNEIQTLADVEVLDTILLQVGPLQSHEKDPDDEDWAAPEYPRLVFKIIAPRDDEIIVEGKRIGRYELDATLSAQSNFAIAKGWLEQCRGSHQNCLIHKEPELPSRVVDVGREDADPKVYSSHNQRAEYVALSHCWGGPIQSVLSSQTITEYSQQLPVAQLPPNFQDAITITRSLGIRYLWIDSLCIIQDSKQDWEKESKKMGSIYRNSTLTISAMASKGSAYGILAPKQRDFSVEPAPVAIKLSPSGVGAARYLRLEREDVHEENLNRLDSDGPLSGRGWCLQEAILSPRQLFYGLEQIYWRCPQGFCAADGTRRGLRIPETRLSDLLRVLHQPVLRNDTEHSLCSRKAFLDDYYALVQQYSHRKLTYASDKLPAFSGISSELESYVNGVYLAGLWSNHLTTGLLWKHDMSTCQHVTPYRAPSWSWASTDHPILFDDREDTDLETPEDELGTIELIDYKIDAKDESNPYGELIFGSMTVRCLTLPYVRSKQHIRGRLSGYHIGHAHLDDTPPIYGDEPETQNNALRTSPTLFIAEDVECTYLLAITRTIEGHEVEFDIDYTSFTDENYLAIIVRIDRDDNDSSRARSIKGLVVSPIMHGDEIGSAKYERVGMFEFPNFRYSRLDSWEQRVMTFV